MALAEALSEWFLAADGFHDQLLAFALAHEAALTPLPCGSLPLAAQEAHQQFCASFEETVRLELARHERGWEDLATALEAPLGLEARMKRQVLLDFLQASHKKGVLSRKKDVL